MPILTVKWISRPFNMPLPRYISNEWTRYLAGEPPTLSNRKWVIAAFTGERTRPSFTHMNTRELLCRTVVSSRMLLMMVIQVDYVCSDRDPNLWANYVECAFISDYFVLLTSFQQQLYKYNLCLYFCQMGMIIILLAHRHGRFKRKLQFNIQWQ